MKAVGRSQDKLAALGSAARSDRRRRRRRGGADRGLRGSDAASDDSGRLHEARHDRPVRARHRAIARAVADAGVRRAVFLSSLGAELAAGTGPVVGLHGAEERLRAITGLALLILRPGYFYENNYGTLALIKHQGINGGAIDPGVAMPTIASADIGELAAEALRTADFSGVVVRELTGPREVTMPEATALIGKAIGKPDLAYVRFPDEGYVAGLESAGFSADAARLFLEMAQAFNKGIIGSQAGNEKVRTTTSFEAFAERLRRPTAPRPDGSHLRANFRHRAFRGVGWPGHALGRWTRRKSSRSGRRHRKHRIPGRHRDGDDAVIRGQLGGPPVPAVAGGSVRAPCRRRRSARGRSCRSLRPCRRRGSSRTDRRRRASPANRRPGRACRSRRTAPGGGRARGSRPDGRRTPPRPAPRPRPGRGADDARSAPANIPRARSTSIAPSLPGRACTSTPADATTRPSAPAVVSHASALSTCSLSVR